MTTARTDGITGEADTRRRLLDVAVVLFIRHSFAGTSLQMIADELGFTKAAIYYHFRTREQLLIAVVEPMLRELRAIVDTAGRQRGPRARAEAMLAGYAALVAANRSIASVLTTDPSVIRVLRHQPEWRDVLERPRTLLAELDPGPSGVVRATAVLTGLAGAASAAPDDIDQDALNRHLLEVGRRILGLRTPRR